MKNSEIKQFTDKELFDKINDTKEALVKMKLNHAISQLDNPLKLRFLKKDIARLKTELKQRELKN